MSMRLYGENTLTYDFPTRTYNLIFVCGCCEIFTEDWIKQHSNMKAVIREFTGMRCPQHWKPKPQLEELTPEEEAYAQRKYEFEHNKFWK